MTNAVLEGASGGQNLRGGTGASENLTLDSTNHATKGSVLIAPVSGNVYICDDSDRLVFIGRAAVGYGGGYSDHAYFGHRDMSGAAAQYAVLQSPAGDTFINAVTGRKVYFRINNINVGSVDSSEWNFDTDVTMDDALTVAGIVTLNGRLVAPGTVAIGEATEIAEANADVVRVGEVDNDWGDYAKFIGAEGPGRWHWGAWENMGTSGSAKSIVFAASAFKPVKAVIAWGLVHNITANAAAKFDVGPYLINTTNTIYDAGGGKTAVLQVGSNGSVILYKTGSDELDIVYQLMWI